MDIGKSIRVACAPDNISQKRLSELSGVSVVTISHLMSGKTKCSEVTLKRLARKFDMSVSEFIALGE